MSILWGGQKPCPCIAHYLTQRWPIIGIKKDSSPEPAATSIFFCVPHLDQISSVSHLAFALLCHALAGSGLRTDPLFDE